MTDRTVHGSLHEPLKRMHLSVADRLLPFADMRNRMPEVRAAAASALVVAATVVISGTATIGGPIPATLPLFPADNWWNADISAAPVDPASASFISFVGTTRALHPDFGG